MTTQITTLDRATQLIQAGKVLLIAGDEALLRQLPKGRWVGGTIPYFMTEEGGVFSREMLAVTQLPDFVGNVTVRSYGKSELPWLTRDEPDRGLSFLILPGSSEVHARFAQEAPTYPGIYLKPLLGWIAGVALDDIGKVRPKTFNGETGDVMEEKAVALHVTLPKGKAARVDIINVFEQGGGETLEFDETGFEVEDCRINGERRNLAEFLAEKKIDTRLPLVADYCGARVNTSFQRVDAAKRQVYFYAPVFEGVKYKIARPVGDYVAEFDKAVGSHNAESALFTCNCILNYVYGSLEGRKTGKFVGPITFGEVGYQLLNQTLVYATIVDVERG